MPIEDFVSFCADQFSSLSDIKAGDEAINDAIQRNHANIEKWCVYQKLALVSTFYKTPIYNTRKLANHIFVHGEMLDRYLSLGDLQAVAIIRQGHNIRTRNNNEWDFFSFASKYACWHEPNKYAIFDRLVAKLLVDLNKQLHFCETPVNRRQFDGTNGYACFKDIIDNFSERFNLVSARYKQLDQGMWVWAKCRYKPNDVMEVLEGVKRQFVNLVTPQVNGSGVWWV